MIKYQQYLSDELTKCQKLCQEAAESVLTQEIRRQLESIVATATATQELIKQNITPPSEMDLTVIQDALREFKEVAPTEQQIQIAFKEIERLSEHLNTFKYKTPNTGLLYWR